MGVLFLLGVAFALLPLSVAVVAYRLVERRHRDAWAPVAARTVRVGSGPYRAAEIATCHVVRAPPLVRASALGCTYWGWFCLIAWTAVASALPAFPEVELLAFVGVVFAAATARAGLRLLRRGDSAAASARGVAVWSVVLAPLVVGVPGVVAASPEGRDALDWVGPAAVYALVTALLAGLLWLTVHRHAGDFARGDEPRSAPERLPGWLARVISKRRLQRRANFLASASHTIPGA
jgi:hypothetical protein